QGTQGIFLGSLDVNGNPSCDLAHVGDPAKCHPCEIVASCFKTCGHCQLCVGKNVLPPDCFPGNAGTDGGAAGPDGGATAGDGGVLVAPDGGIAGQCPSGETPCGVPGEPPC